MRDGVMTCRVGAAAAWALALCASSAQGRTLALLKPGEQAAYLTVSDARTGLEHRADVGVSDIGGWRVFVVRSTHETWSFSPEGAASYPCAVMRSLHEEDGARSVRSRVMCEADKAACDRLVGQVNRFDQRGGAGALHPPPERAASTAPARADTADLQDSTAQIVTAGAGTRDAQVLCRTTQDTGTRLGMNRKCMTRVEWQLRDATYKEQIGTALKDMRNSGH